MAANVNFNANEQKLIKQAIELAITSAARAQKNSKSPEIAKVYGKHEAELRKIQIKLAE